MKPTEDHLVKNIITVCFTNQRELALLRVSALAQEYLKDNLPVVGGVYKLIDVDYQVDFQDYTYIFQRVDG